jgi:hypothetical protein
MRPGFGEARFLLGYIHLAARRYAAVRDALTPLVQADPANHDAALLLAEALLGLNDPEGATALLGPVLSRATETADRDRARTLLGMVAGLQRRRNTLKAAGIALSDAAPRLTLAPQLRPAGSGEQRVYGVFQSVECERSGVVLVVRTADAVLRASAPSLADVEFITYRSDRAGNVTCGEQSQPSEVYLTWRVPPESSAGTEGTAVAVEVLPEGFVPSP